MPILGSRGGGAVKGFGLTAGQIAPPTWVSAPDPTFGTSPSGDFNDMPLTGGADGAIGVGAFNPGPGQSQTVGAAFDGTSWGSNAGCPYDVFQNGIFGDLTGAVTMGGAQRPAQNVISNSAEYNGTSWSTTGSINSAKRGTAACSGTEPSGLMVGANPPSGGGGATDQVESYNGSTWANETNYPAITRNGAVIGETETDIIVAGGNNASGTYYSGLNAYNGSAWSDTGAALSAGRSNIASFGPTSNGLFAAGYDGTSPGNVNTVEIWDGTALSTGTTYPVSQSYFASNGSATSGGNASRGGGYVMANNGPYATGLSNFWISE